MGFKLTLADFERKSNRTRAELKSFEEKVCNISTNVEDAAVEAETFLSLLEKFSITFDEEFAPYKALSGALTDLTLETIDDTIKELSDQHVHVLCALKKIVARAERARPVSYNNGQTTVPGAAAKPAVKLPPLQVPSFSGEAQDWDLYFARFQSLVHTNQAINTLQKFQFLLNSLSPQALQLVSHLPFADAQYDVAIKLLHERYHNPRRVVAHHTNQLLCLKSVTFGSFSSIRSLVDHTQVHLRALQALPTVEPAEAFMAAFLLSKLDHKLRAHFELHGKTQTDYPTVENVLDFLNDQLRREENAALFAGPSKPLASVPAGPSFVPRRQGFVSAAKSSPPFLPTPQRNGPSCNFCASNQHKIYQCQKFTSHSPQERRQWITSNNQCTNCLGVHSNTQCNSNFSCRLCQQRHHTLLHIETSKWQPLQKPISSSSALEVKPPGPSSGSPQALVSTVLGNTVLMATALIKLQTSPHHYKVVRALIDTAAAASFLTERCAQILKCPRTKCPIPVSGLGNIPSTARGTCRLSIVALQGEVVMEDHPFLIMPSITTLTPQVKVSADIRRAVNHLTLADPTFDKPTPVDCILGADIAALVLGTAPHIRLGPNMPLGVHSSFGVIIMGSAPPLDSVPPPSVSTTLLAIPALCATPQGDLHQLVENFWRTEEPPPAPPKLTTEETWCEEFFSTTTSRSPSGRYTVRLPLLPSPKTALGASFKSAYSRFMSLERRFARDPIFKSQYVEFMTDYLHQGHMIPATGPTYYFIPHHAVFKAHGDTSKIRVVFNATHKTTSGASLNDLLFAGPKLQPLLADIISRFRLFNFVFTCDIAQMFRQIDVAREDHPYQCILWRDRPDVPLRPYYLTTVTYGTRCAPYLALRTLARLVEDEGSLHPLAATALTSHTFVDDIAVGSNTIQDALLLRADVIDLLAKGGFTLKKWVANDSRLLKGLAPDSCSCLADNLDFSLSVLGLQWDLQRDSLALNVDINTAITSPALNKRTVLSIIASIFDPCGWAAPFVMAAKQFLQQLWGHSLDWDTQLPPELSIKWKPLLASIRNLNQIKLPRPITSCTSNDYVLHGFCDASKGGYAAVLFLAPNIVHSKPTLLAAKTRVAPVRHVTIPRLELCGAHLLASIAHHFRKTLSSVLCITAVHLWTDSMIVLSWLNSNPQNLNTYVGNRVGQILDWTADAEWHHVPTLENPADLASRGVLFSSSECYTLWWNGPTWLSDPSNWPQPADLILPTPPTETLTVPALIANTSTQCMFSACSSWHKICLVTARILSWRPRYRTTRLLNREVAARLCYYLQRNAFADEIHALENSKPTTLRIRRLDPFFDDFGLLRVGGRLAHAPDHIGKHPILLPKRHHLVNLLIDHAHQQTLHSGPKSTQSYLSQEYWILSARQAIRSRIAKCVACFRMAPQVSPPLMGQLPPPRVNPAPAFYQTGMDFAGPFPYKASHLRKAPVIKGYLCLFICMATRAVHLELASDLSTIKFITVLNRFISRRGCPAHLYSDCGTNFTGAAAAFNHSMQRFLNENDTSAAIQDFCFPKNITFHFNTPAAPHQGGLWERAIRSAKSHLTRILNNLTPTYEELSTFFTQVEGVLNSRPITPTSQDPSDLTALTPGHFIIGRPITAPPPVVTAERTSAHRGFRQTQDMLEAFWQQWRHDYLQTLQPRSKWEVNKVKLGLNDLVVVHEPNAPPISWPLGRITKVFPGKDGVVRSAEVRTQNGNFIRPAVKLYRLPI